MATPPSAPLIRFICMSSPVIAAGLGARAVGEGKTSTVGVTVTDSTTVGVWEGRMFVGAGVLVSIAE